MEKAKSSPNLLWLIFRRCMVHLFSGFVTGAISGAIYIGIAGYTIGFATHGVPGFVENDLASIGEIVGLGFGAAVGGIIGALVWTTAGFITPPSLKLLPSAILVRSTVQNMGLATLSAIVCYFAWCFCFALIKYGWSTHDLVSPL